MTAPLNWMKEDFKANPDMQKEVVKDLTLFNSSTIKTQQAIAQEALYNQKLFKHCAEVAVTAMETYEKELEEKDQTIKYISAENNEYRKQYGDLNEESVKKIRDSNQLAYSTSQSKSKNILKRLQVANKQVLEKDLALNKK